MILYNDKLYNTFNEAMQQLIDDNPHVPDDFIPNEAEGKFSYVDNKTASVLEPLLS